MLENNNFKNSIEDISNRSRISAVEKKVDEVETENMQLSSKIEVYHKRLGVVEKIGVAFLGGINDKGEIIAGFINDIKPWLEYCQQCKIDKENQAKEKNSGFFNLKLSIIGTLLVALIVGVFTYTVKTITSSNDKVSDLEMAIKQLEENQKK